VKRTKADLPDEDIVSGSVSLATRTQELGSSLVRAAKQSIQDKHTKKLVDSTAWLIEQKRVFVDQINGLQSAVEYIDRKLEAIETGAFTIEHGTVIFDDSDFNRNHREFFGDRSEWSVG
jgi:hypothetical protein